MFGKLKISGEIEVVTGMHIGGSSQFSAIGAVDSPVIRDSYTDKPMIPGSSFKGKMRTLLAKQYSRTAMLQEHNADPEIVLRLFGSSNKNAIRPSRLLFSDMFLLNEQELKAVGIDSVTEVKFENSINRLTAIANPRQIERTIRGSKFGLDIIYNVEEEKEIEEDFKAIKEGMLLLEYDYIGGHGSRGYGKIKINGLKVETAIGDVDSKVIDSCNEICLKIISTVMYFTPIGVFCTIVPVVEANGTKTILSLATQLIILYVTFYGFALFIYGGSVKILGKTSPVKFFKAIMPAALNAFGTCSSSATIPISKQCVEEELGVSNKITSITIPLGATVNMDAVSILMSFMIMFFANACGINVSISMMVIILLANVLLSVGTPGIPGGAIASFAALATMAGLPAGVMGVYISINTLCDMGATCVNVIGDMAGCVVLQEKIKLEEN